MIDRLLPTILKLQTVREPITVYIDSRGGNLESAELLLRLLTASNQDGAPPCRIITVVTNQASSAAADFLSSGDYAIALPGTSIFYHGVRQSSAEPVTVEAGSALTERLKISNSQSAMALARKTEQRFMYLFVVTRTGFQAHRESVNNSTKTDLACFVSIIMQKLTPYAQRLVERALVRQTRYDALLDKALVAAFRGNPNLSTSPGVAKTEAAILKKIIDFEVAQHKKDTSWSFHGGGLSRMNDDFFLLREYISISQSEQLSRLCERWGFFVLTEEQQAELAAIEDEEARKQARVVQVRPFFQPLWSFLVALCHTLQEGEENFLSALDAYWLGLIDEVIGEDLPFFRLLSEVRPDPEPASI
jgi:ATP-dependent protease ClpP protease subunit